MDTITPPSAWDFAREYLDKGWSVVPVKPGSKVPAVHWLQYQTTPPSQDRVDAWFADGQFGVGIVTGAVSGIFVIDVDPGGDETLARLENLHGPLPKTVQAFTPRGGSHILFRHPGYPIQTRANIAQGIDVRGDGGFIVATPSLHENGTRYVWDVDRHPDETPIADAPAWLLEAVKAPANGETRADPPRSTTEAPGAFGMPGDARIDDGREAYMRDTLLAVLQEYVDSNGAWPSVEELVEEAWPQYSRNVSFTRPGRGIDEMRVKAAITLRRAQAGLIRGFMAPGRRQKPGAEQQGTEQGGAQANPKPNLLPIISFDDVRPNLDAADFVEGLLIEGAMTVVYGPSNCGKTFFVTDLCLHIAAGWKWRGREVEAGAIAYVALEGSHGISNRVAAFKTEHGIVGGVPFYIIPVSINLLDPDADRQRLVDTIKAKAAEAGVRFRVVVIDTLSRAMAGGNENAPDDMGALVTNADYVRQSLSSHFILIHHTGKDQAQGARGHSLLRAATDTEIEISRASSTSPSVARVTKQRELEIDGEFVFALKVVELGNNRRGKAVTSCVVEPVEADATTKQTKQPRLSPGAAMALVALTEALAKAGTTSTMPGLPDGVVVVPITLWRKEFYARSVLETQHARNAAFNRGVKALVDASAAAVLEGFAWKVY